MSDAERDRWNERYRDGAYERRAHPTALLSEWLPRLPAGRALDVACGAGRNALYLAANGYRVDALDVSDVALARARRSAAERGVDVHWICADLDEPRGATLPRVDYDLIVWVRYIHRDLMPHLVERLRPGGALLCEQHLSTGATVAGPRNPGFRLAPGELELMARDLQVLHYNEGPIVDPDGRTVALAQLVARAPG
jgi:tellurite methyltransferase